MISEDKIISYISEADDNIIDYIISIFINSSLGAKSQQELIDRIQDKRFDKNKISNILNDFFKKKILKIDSTGIHGNFYGIDRENIKKYPEIYKRFKKKDDQITASYYGSGASIRNGSKYTGD